MSAFASFKEEWRQKLEEVFQKRETGMTTYTIRLTRLVPGDPNCAPHDHLNYLVANMQRTRFTCEVCGAEYQEERVPLSPLRQIACVEAAREIERISRS